MHSLCEVFLKSLSQSLPPTLLQICFTQIYKNLSWNVYLQLFSMPNWDLLVKHNGYFWLHILYTSWYIVNTRWLSPKKIDLLVDYFAFERSKMCLKVRTHKHVCISISLSSSISFSYMNQHFNLGLSKIVMHY